MWILFVCHRSKSNRFTDASSILRTAYYASRYNNHVARTSSISSHPQSQKIIEAIVSRQPYRDIEKWTNPPVTRGSLSRFARDIQAKTRDAIGTANTALAQYDAQLPDSVTNSVTHAALVAASDPFYARIQKHQVTLDREIGTSTGDARGIAALISTDLKGLELHARLAGRLDAPAPTTNILIVCPAGTQPAQVQPDDTDIVTIDIGKSR